MIKKLANRSPSQVDEKGGVAIATATTPQKTLYSKEDMMRAEQIKILGDLYDEKFSIAEKMRMEKVVEEHRESHANLVRQWYRTCQSALGEIDGRDTVVGVARHARPLLRARVGLRGPTRSRARP